MYSSEYMPRLTNEQISSKMAKNESTIQNTPYPTLSSASTAVTFLAKLNGTIDRIKP
jgi:hypothetical protein